MPNKYISTVEQSKPITNIDTGLKIEIRKSGINETFGNPKYYDNLTKDLKLAKIASMSELAKMIKYGEVRAKDSFNYHNPRSETKFSYLKSSINIDSVNYDVTMDIKRLPSNENIFYIHALKIKKQETNSLRRISSNALKENLPLANNNISQNDDIVNNSLRKNSDNDTKFSIGEEKEKWQPIKPCEKTQKVLDRLAEDKPVSLALISELPEIVEGYSRRGHINPTVNINTTEREKLRTQIQKEVESLGSAKLDKSGKWVYNGNIEQGHRVDIVIGLPAAGKSTVLANPLSATYQSRIVDSDIVKEKLPEFDNGYGADNVHEESKVINEQILKDAVINGENIVLPIVGSKYTKLLTQVMDFKTQGYSVYLHLNKLPMNKSLGRMLNRFLTDGRFLDPIISFKYQNKPTEVFDRIIKTKGEFLDGYSEYSNDVERGQDPIFIRGTENIQEAYKRTDKRISETDSENVRESGRNRGLSNSQTLSGEEEKKYSIAFEIEENLKSLNEQYGTKKKGENPVRDIDVPEKSSDNKRVREFVKTILESGALTDEMVNEVSDELVKDTLSYEPMSNENVLRVANEWLDNNGKGVTEKHWSDWGVISNGRHKVTALDIAKGELLLKSAAQNNDTKKVVELTAEISEMATVAGQTVQAMRLLKKSTGLGQLCYVS